MIDEFSKVFKVIEGIQFDIVINIGIGVLQSDWDEYVVVNRYNLQMKLQNENILRV